MIDDSQNNIRIKVIETIISEYIMIFWLSPEDSEIVWKNLSHMTDIELWNEILHIQEYYASSAHTYQKALINTVHIQEEEEKSNHKNILINF